MFVFRGGRWRLFPPSGFGDSGISEQQRQLERQSSLTEIPSDYLVAMEQAVEESLVNTIDYQSALDTVRTTVRAPESDIPFSWTPETTAADDGRFEVAVVLAFRMDTLVFQLGEGGFRTDMTVQVRVLGDEDAAGGSERIQVVVPESEMDGRREEIVRRTVALERSLAPGDYRLEIVLEDALLGYRTSYEGEISVGS